MEILLTILGLYGVGSLMIIICLEAKYREFMRGEKSKLKKVEIMKELIDRYEQLKSMNGCKSARDTVELYIKKLELELKKLL